MSDFNPRRNREYTVAVRGTFWLGPMSLFYHWPRRSATGGHPGNRSTCVCAAATLQSYTGIGGALADCSPGTAEVDRLGAWALGGTPLAASAVSGDPLVKYMWVLIGCLVGVPILCLVTCAATAWCTCRKRHPRCASAAAFAAFMAVLAVGVLVVVYAAAIHTAVPRLVMKASGVGSGSAPVAGAANGSLATATTAAAGTEVVSEDISAASLAALGVYVHSLADSYSHEACLCNESFVGHATSPDLCAYTIWHEEEEWGADGRGAGYTREAGLAVWRAMRDYAVSRDSSGALVPWNETHAVAAVDGFVNLVRGADRRAYANAQLVALVAGGLPAVADNNTAATISAIVNATAGEAGAVSSVDGESGQANLRRPTVFFLVFQHTVTILAVMVGLWLVAVVILVAFCLRHRRSFAWVYDKVTVEAVDDGKALVRLASLESGSESSAFDISDSYSGPEGEVKAEGAFGWRFVRLRDVGMPTIGR